MYWTTITTTLITVLTVAYVFSLFSQPIPTTRPIRPDEYPSPNLEIKLLGFLGLGMQGIATLLLLTRNILTCEISPMVNLCWSAIFYIIYSPAKIFASATILIYWINIFDNSIPYVTENLVVSILLLLLLLMDGIATCRISFKNLFNLSTSETEKEKGKERGKSKEKGKEEIGYTMMVDQLKESLMGTAKSDEK